MLLAPPYLVSSPIAPFLVNYRPDTVGLSASLHPWHGRKNQSAKRQKTGYCPLLWMFAYHSLVKYHTDEILVISIQIFTALVAFVQHVN